MKLTVLGSGTSHGIPVIGCSCPVCTAAGSAGQAETAGYSSGASAASRDRRMRSSLYIEGDSGERAVIDTGPEFRLQALAANITRLDAVFLTHAHADHIHGLDDIRPLCGENPIPVYGNAPTIDEFRERFAYIFKETQRGGGKPRIETIAVSGPVQLGNLVFTPLPVKHGALDILGWKISGPPRHPCRSSCFTTGEFFWAALHGGLHNAVYLTDTSFIGEDTFRLVGKGPELAVIGALRERPHDTHFCFDEALEAALRMEAKRVYLTHICHSHSHREIETYCRDFAVKRGLEPSWAAPAWDGLELTV